MHVKTHIIWLGYVTAVVVSISLGLTTDTTTPHIYNGEQKDFFRNKVLQILSGKNKEAAVTAIQQQARPEETYQFTSNQTHICLVLPVSLTDAPIPVEHFGLSVNRDSTDSKVTVCKHNNSSLTNVCYRMTDHRHRESSEKTVELLFLFDGSGSMTERDFNKNKDFIIDMMNSLKNSSVKFAAVQFSTECNKVFDFNDYQDGTALQKLQEEPHMKQLTHTHKALTFVLENLFENSSAGASPDATKVVIIITDGNPSDSDRNHIVQRYNEKNIIRFVIGVKVSTLNIFQAIASHPTEKHAFRIENYDGLTGNVEFFKTKILIIDGSEAAQSGVSFKVSYPNVVHTPHENSFVNSLCYKIPDQLQQASSLRPACPECSEKTVELVFLFDGSGSMTERDFNKNKYFIMDIMNSFKNSSVKFAAVQFATECNKVFDFNNYQDGTALEKLQEEPHMKQLTNTHKALTFVLENLFENSGAGASPDATKVVIIITDGNPSDSDRNHIVQTYNEKKIIRFVIGVKKVSLEKLQTIASRPAKKYTFKIENYDGLVGILENVQKKIFTMEGSTVARAGDQSGISAVFYNDNLMIGSLRSNSWRSSLQENPNQMDSYIGNSVCVGKKNNELLYFTGSPRFQQIGQVIALRHNSVNWTPSQRLNGDQIGSYFGAELCSVDINSDGDTDFLMVGAPLFHQPQEKTEGQIYVYRLTDALKLESTLNVTASSMGRFGTTIASLADLNGDGLRDVAVGAPLEDDNSGAVYIYLGDRHEGIRDNFSQRVTGLQIQPGLRFFGHAIDGDVDIGEDGLPHIAIGSQDTAVVLRSRLPIAVLGNLSFEQNN